MYGHRWYGGLPAAAWRLDRPFHMTVFRVSEVSEASVYRIPSGLTLSNRYVKRFLKRKTPLDQCMHVLPDFISQPIFLHGCEIKSGSGLGMRL